MGTGEQRGGRGRDDGWVTIGEGQFSVGRLVRDVRLRSCGHDAGARRTFLDHGAGVADVHLRKDLG